MQVVDTASNSNLGSGQPHIPSSFPCARVPHGKQVGARAKNSIPSPGAPVSSSFWVRLFFGILRQSWQQDHVMCILSTVLGVMMLRVQANAT